MHGSLGVSFTQCAVGYKEASLERACYGKDGVGGVMRAYEANWAAQTSERGERNGQHGGALIQHWGLKVVRGKK